MGLSRSFFIGIASLFMVAVLCVYWSAYFASEVKNREIEELTELHNRKVEGLENKLRDAEENLNHTQEALDELLNNYTILEHKLETVEQAYEKASKEKVELKRKLQSQKNPQPLSSRGSSPVNGRKMNVEATAYTAFCSTGCIGVTTTGIDVKNTITHNGKGIIATDPKVIPLGTEVDINGKRYVAQDTGGAIKGNKIDILMATKREANNFGRRNIEITIIN